MQPVETISITLPDDLVRLIREKVSTGAYASVSEVIREAVRVWQDREREQEAHLADIRVRIERSLADPRPSRPMDEVFDRLERRHAGRAKGRDDL